MGIKVGLLFDYSSKIGWGHRRRMEALAGYMVKYGITHTFYPNFFCRFIEIGEIGREVLREDIYILDLSAELYVRHFLSKILFLIEYLKQNGKKVVLFDGLFKSDCIHKNVCTNSDLVIIPYFLATPEEFFFFNGGSNLLGEEFFVYNPFVLTLKSKMIQKDDFILVSLGGSREKVSIDLIDTLISSELLSRLKLKIVGKPSFVLDLRYNSDNVEFLPVQDHKSFLLLLKRAKLLITSTGLTKYEALALNTPVIVLDLKKRFKDYYKKLETILPMRYCNNLKDLPVLIEDLLSLQLTYEIPLKGGEKVCTILKEL